MSTSAEDTENLAGYENIRNYIGLSDDFESSNPVPEEKLKNLQEVMDWIFGSKMRDVKRCVVTQNPDLRKLVEILGNDLSVSALKASGDINIAYDLTIDDNDALREALANARLALNKATSKVGSFTGDEGLVRQSGTVLNLAQTVYDRLFKIYDEIKYGKKEILSEENQ